MTLQRLKEMVRERVGVLLGIVVVLASICAGIAAANAFKLCGVITNLGQALTEPGCRPDWGIGIFVGAAVFVCLGLMALAVYQLERLLSIGSGEM